MEERIREVLETVLSKVKPTEEEEKRIISVVERIRDLLRGLDVEVHGSFRKGTWLRGDTDVDLFVFFPKEVGKEFLSKEGLDTIKERLKGLEVKMAYAEHPYLIVSLDGIEVDVVPALRVGEGSEAVTAVDRTPFHTMYVTSKLDERGRDQVRLLKRFLKGVGVYGAEIKVLGFSGYVSELLTIYYGSFLEVLKGASKWRPPVKIPLVEEGRQFESPLIIPDPVDPKRNAAAAVSLRSMAIFSLAAREFLVNPSLDFFFPPEPDVGPVLGDVLVTEVEVLEPFVDDVLWGQMRKSLDKAIRALETVGFKVVDYGACEGNGKVYLLIQMESAHIGEYTVYKGPPFYLETSRDFISKNFHVWVGEDGRLYSLKRRHESSPEMLVGNSLALKYKHMVRQYWLKEVKDPCMKLFLRKRPLWLK